MVLFELKCVLEAIPTPVLALISVFGGNPNIHTELDAYHLPF